MLEQTVFATLLFVFYLLVFVSFLHKEELTVSESIETVTGVQSPEKAEIDTSLLNSMNELIELIVESEYVQQLIQEKKDIALKDTTDDNSQDLTEEEELKTDDNTDSVILEIISIEDENQEQEAINTLAQMFTTVTDNGQVSTAAVNNELPKQTELFEIPVPHSNELKSIDDPELDSQISEERILQIEAQEEEESLKITQERELETQKGLEELFQEMADTDHDETETDTVSADVVVSQEEPQAYLSTSQEAETEEIETATQEEENQDVTENNSTAKSEEINHDESDVSINEKTTELIGMFQEMPSTEEMIHGIKLEIVDALKVKQLKNVAKELNIKLSYKVGKKHKNKNRKELIEDIMSKLKVLEIDEQNEIAEFIENMA